MAKKVTAKKATAKKAPVKKSNKRNFEEVGASNFSYWSPEEKEEIEGTLSEFETVPAKGKFAESERGVLETEEGQIVKLPSHFVLTKKLKECEEGDYVKITYEGLIQKGEGKKATKYHSYKVERAV